MRSQVKATFDGLQEMVEKRRQEINTKLQEEENSVVTPKRAKKTLLEEQKASVAAHAGSVERLVVPSPDSVLLGMLEKLKTRLDDLEKQTQLSPDSQDFRLAFFIFDSDMVNRSQAGQGDVISLVDKLPTDLATMALVESKRTLTDSHVCSVCENLEQEVLDVQEHFNSVRSDVQAIFGGLHQMVEKTTVLLGMLEKLRTRLDDLERQTQLSPDSQDVRLAFFTFDSDMVKRFEEAFVAFGAVTTKGGTVPGKVVDGNKKGSVYGQKKPKVPSKPSGPVAGLILKPGDRVRRGKDWKWENEVQCAISNKGFGLVVKASDFGSSADWFESTVGRNMSACAEGWVRIHWDAGGTIGDYRMGAQYCYDLTLA
nr:hypothetical protein BaRGS_021121 [Batillaria attramentaria]